MSDTTSPSDENHGSGLWLWHGKASPAPLQPGEAHRSPRKLTTPSAVDARPLPTSRVQQSLGPIFSALRRAGWMALPGGVALTLLAVMLHSTPPDTPAPADTAAVALEPVPSPAAAHAVISAPPVDIPAPRVEHTDTQPDQAQMPSAPAAPLPARGTEHELATKPASRTSARTARKTHALAGRNSPFVIHGVLTPPDPTVWHRGGH